MTAQKSRSPCIHVHAETNLRDVRLLAGDTLAAAFPSQDPPIDAILIKQPILDFIVRREQQEWQPLALEDGRPFLLTRELYTVVTAESRFRLQ